MTEPSLMFPGRFNGPPGSANGGYACGVIAGRIPADLVEVTLLRPPPLDTELLVEETGPTYEVHPPGGEVVAVAKPVDEPVEVLPPVLDIPADAEHALADASHPFRSCFTCGPDREPGDGLRIFVKRLAGQSILADQWTPDESLADDAGAVRPEIVWAALDCPGGWAAFNRIPGGVAVLGRMTAHIERVPRAGEPCVVVATSDWHEGRKIGAHSALYTAEGDLLAAARAVWIDSTA
ncbi:hypothetical protein FHT40_005075 [Mycolicibacterium sp. BK556]|uniref:hypothetical protein n=1 Tax=unclassified Mycolicibacterium TaxID=2636767 RepID=UPI001607B107|nr:MULTISPECIES: hypothetical protein [unclassified Mycolicibacterium]MBB3605391.1 hypothetical protein [Mycolicibacterium sp. BK556]MBB3635587.1 hypothetical protein [Mycolicibacterium sp. BK607]MBB3747622.1 hypothetical protein [Mycolicibacterium sp. BK634]